MSFVLCRSQCKSNTINQSSLNITLNNEHPKSMYITRYYKLEIKVLSIRIKKNKIKTITFIQDMNRTDLSIFIMDTLMEMPMKQCKDLSVFSLSYLSSN